MVVARRVSIFALVLVLASLTVGIAAWAAADNPPGEFPPKSMNQRTAADPAKVRPSQAPSNGRLELPAGGCVTPLPLASSYYAIDIPLHNQRFQSVQVNIHRTSPAPNDVYNILGDAANEPSIAVDPREHGPGLRRMAIGWNDFPNAGDGSCVQAGVAFSNDGGKNWYNPTVGTNVTLRDQLGYPVAIDELNPDSRGDPVLASDKDGNFYYSSLLDGSHQAPSGGCWASAAGSFLVDIFKSGNGGADWGVQSVLAWGGDKQWLAVDPAAAAGDNIYVAWHKHSSCYLPECDCMDFTRSEMNGSSYTFPDLFAAITETREELYPVTMDVDSTGTLYIVGAVWRRFGPFSWNLADDHYVVKSTNAKSDAVTPTFVPQEIELGGSSVYDPPKEPFFVSSNLVNPAGLAGQVWVATNRSPGHDDEVYVAGSVNPPDWPRNNEPLDVHFLRGTRDLNDPDRKVAWEPWQKINDDTQLSSGKAWQWFATMSVAPNGRIDIVWNDSRNAPTNTTNGPRFPTHSQLFYSHSFDGGRTWSPNEEVTPLFPHGRSCDLIHPSLYPGDASNPAQAAGRKLGDYYHMVSDNGGGNLAYAATFDILGSPMDPNSCNANHLSRDYEQNIFFVRVTPDCNCNDMPDEDDIMADNGLDLDVDGTIDSCKLGRCCRADGACEATEYDGCVNPDDVFTPRVWCPIDEPCTTEMGTCCTGTGNCLVTTAECCSGTFTSSATCANTQACCASDGSCIESTTDCCTEGGGTVQAGSQCTPPGACCMADSTCIDTSEECCQGANQHFTANSTCGATSACHIGANCVQTSAACCAQAPGTFDPANDCDSGGCKIRPGGPGVQTSAVEWRAEDPLARVKANGRLHGLLADKSDGPVSDVVFDERESETWDTSAEPGGAEVDAIRVTVDGVDTDAALPNRNRELNITGTAGFNSIRLALKEGDSDTLEVFAPVGGTRPGFQVSLGEFDSIRVDGGEGDDLIVLDDANGPIAGIRSLDIDTGGGVDVVLGATGQLSVPQVLDLLDTLQSARELTDHVGALVAMMGATGDLGAGNDDMISNAVTLLAETRTEFVLPAADFVQEFNDTLIVPVADDVVAIRDGLITDSANFIQDANTGLATSVMNFKDELQADLVDGPDGAYALAAAADALHVRADDLQSGLDSPCTGLNNAAALHLSAQILDLADQIEPLLPPPPPGPLFDCDLNEPVETPGIEFPDVCPDIEAIVECMERLIEEFEALGDLCECEADRLAKDAEAVANPPLETLAETYEALADGLEAEGDALVGAGEMFVDAAETFAMQLEAEIWSAADALITGVEDQFEGAEETFSNEVTAKIDDKAGEMTAEAALLVQELQQIMTTARAVLELGMAETGRGGRYSCADVAITITGGPGANVLVGTRCNDVIRGGGGLDLIIGGPGDDQLFAGDGSALVFGGPGVNGLHGGKGPDLMIGGPGVDTFFGEDGLDLLVGLGDDDELDGGNYIDILIGDNGDDLLNGGAGIDLLIGDLSIFPLNESGHDTINGDDCIDVLIGGNGQDVMYGGPGQTVEIGTFSIELGNVLIGGNDVDTMRGTADPPTQDNGIDVMLGGAQGDTLNGGNGGILTIGDFDMMLGNVILGQADNDIITSAEGFDVLLGGDGNDTITAGNGFTLELFGGSFELELGDLLFGGEGDDVLNGDDPVSNPSQSGQQDLDLSFGGEGMDILNGFEGGLLTIDDYVILIGNVSFGGPGDYRDEIHTTAGIDFSFGGDGGDLIQSGQGNLFENQAGTFKLDFGDFLFGMDGADELHGNAPTASGDSDDGDIDVIFGGPKGDVIFGGGGGVVQIGQPGSSVDFVFGDLIFAGDGPDEIHGDVTMPPGVPAKHGIDLIFAGTGDDEVHAGPGSKIDISSGGVVVNFGNAVFAGTGDDVVFGADDSLTYPVPAGIELGGGIDVVFGADGGDTIDTGSGIDLVFARQGDDTLGLGDGGAVWINGSPPVIFGNIAFAGDGIDTIRSAGLLTEIDVLFGGPCGDWIEAGDGLLDICFGGLGDDTIVNCAQDDLCCITDPYCSVENELLGVDVAFGGPGIDTIGTGNGTLNLAFAGRGKDIVRGGAAVVDVLFGGPDDDDIKGGDGASVPNLDVVFSGPGNDAIDGQGGASTISVLFANGDRDGIIAGNGLSVAFGNTGSDFMEGDGLVSVLFANDGDDHVRGGPVFTLAFGNIGDDLLVGGGGGNVSLGNAGDDHFEGGSVNLYLGNTGGDCIFGGNGVNLLLGGLDGDSIIGGDGLDVALGGADGDLLWGGKFTDVLLGNGNDDGVYGEGGLDLVCGNRGADTLNGGIDADLVFGNRNEGGGMDVVNGGGGSDWVLGNRQADIVYPGNDSVRDRVLGGFGDDNLFRCTPDDRLYGGKGSDTKGSSCDDPSPPGVMCGLIRGAKRVDRDGDGTLDVGLGGVVIFLDAGPPFDGLPDRTTTTRDDGPDTGDYFFSQLPAGSYRVYETTPDGYSQDFPSAPPYHFVTLGRTNPSEVGLDFENTALCRPAPDGLTCAADQCTEPPNLCVPMRVGLVGACALDGLPCVDEEDCSCGGGCDFAWRIIECGCAPPDQCHVDLPPPEPQSEGPYCIGVECPEGMGTCKLFACDNEYRCGCPPPPPGDSCFEAINVTPGVYLGSTIGATRDAPTDCSGAADGADVWYEFQAPFSGTLTVDTCAGADFDTVVTVHEGSCHPPPGELVCNDNSCGNRSRAVLTVVDGGNYLISVAGNGCAGSFTLTIDLAPSIEAHMASPHGAESVNTLCSERTGACCDRSQIGGVCTNDVPASACVEIPCLGAQKVFFEGETCAELEALGECPEHTGACCNTQTGVCVDAVVPGACPDELHVWTKDTPCVEVECEADVLGACCDHRPSGGCTITTQDDCDCSACQWFALLTCDDIECPHDAVPTLSQWGLFVLLLGGLSLGTLVFGRRTRADAAA
ncbi:MAG: hypothetical protein HOP29_16375 [Phycisphaerales bacterium]|nr:hypothetical protein [Phycisphaerales bacterium]